MDLIQESTFLAAVNEHLIHRETNSLNNKGGDVKQKYVEYRSKGHLRYKMENLPKITKPKPTGHHCLKEERLI